MQISPRALQALEYGRVSALLAEHTTWSPGRRLALALSPSCRTRTVARWQLETAEAKALVGKESVPMGGLRDIRSTVSRAERGAVLAADELLEVASTAGGASRLRGFLLRRAEHYPALSGWADLMSDTAELAHGIQHAIDDEGVVRDRASSRLAALRKRLQILNDRVRERMEAMIRSAETRSLLQEPVVTLRGGRYVIPVRREHRARVPGLVHDQSGSGATLFIEPQVVVELNNARRQAESEEREEVRRILAELSGRVAGSARRLRENQGYMTRLDLALARGKLSWSMDAVAPELGSAGLELEEARHPLLGRDAVPITLSLSPTCRIVVVTGPNTGGKTVSLKTVGLMVVMAQAGMQLPVARAALPIFRRLFVDIGDEQGLEQSLSTFSSHLRNVVPVTREADASSLVLLDELGAGTDPLEGSALAMAVLEELLSRGAFALASTHYSELKSFAFLQEGLDNASMEFDPETLAPTFRLVMGMPGRSNAFEIAARLGMPPEVLVRAGEHMSREDTRSEDLISRMHQAHRQRQDMEKYAARDRAAAQELKSQWQQKLQRLEQQRAAQLELARQKAGELVEQAKRESALLVERLRELERQAQGGAVSAREWEQVRARLSELEREVRVPPPLESAGQDALLRPHLGPWGPGDAVVVISLSQQGRVVSPPDEQEQMLVQVGSIRMRIPAADAALPPESAPSPPQPRSTVSRGGSLGRAKAAGVSSEVHVRGLVAEEALEVVDKYLDDALLAGLKRVRIVHGKGTGTLRRVVSQYLESHPQVTGFAAAEPRDGGLGATEVYLGPQD